jgi:hypothetical protein
MDEMNRELDDKHFKEERETALLRQKEHEALISANKQLKEQN